MPRPAPPARYRIRRCTGNPLMLYIAALRPDGSEIDLFLPGTTAATVDALLTLNRAALSAPGATLELDRNVYAA